MACRQILVPLVHNWRPRTEFQRCFADGCNQILVASVAHDNQCINSYYASIEKVLSELELRFSGNDQEILFASALSLAEASLCCRAGRLGRKKKRAHGARREASAKETGVALRIICHSETPDKECFSHVAKFYKIDGEILEAEQKMCATFRRVRGLDHITVPEMLETMHENDLFDMFPVFSNVVHILGVIPATLCDCVLQNDHSLRCQGRSQLFD